MAIFPFVTPSTCLLTGGAWGATAMLLMVFSKLLLARGSCPEKMR
jgi:hypothetical protein